MIPALNRGCLELGQHQDCPPLITVRASPESLQKVSSDGSCWVRPGALAGLGLEVSTCSWMQRQ